MKRFLLILLIPGLLLLTACDLFPAQSPPATNVSKPTGSDMATNTPGAETPSATEFGPENTQAFTEIPPTQTVSPFSPTTTPEPPPNTPTITPTKQLALKPTATPHLLGIQVGSPARLPNFAHPDLGCQWLGVAGQVFDGDGIPMPGLVVEVGGSIAGQPAAGMAVTGTSESYGPGSYEIKLGDAAVTSNGTVWAQVYDLDGLPLSEPIFFGTSADCDKNLVLLNFVQSYNLPDNWAFLPLIFR